MDNLRPNDVSFMIRPENLGGLGLKRLYEWNVSSIGKYVWWIAMKTDQLWVRWVHAVYLNHKTWEEYVPTEQTSWTWRRICFVKSILYDGIA